MYTIKQAAARSGVSVPLLRAWDRRYHVVSPARTASGYRLYDDDALERIRTMRRLVAAGWTPSNAAGAILSGAPIDLPDAEPGADAPAPGRGRDTRLDESASRLVDRFVEAAAALDGDGLERVLDRMFAMGSFEVVADSLLLPGLVALGEGWAAGRVGVAGEHAASHAALRRLAAAFQAAGRAAPSDGAILVGMPPGVRHELGALAFATAARRAGLPILYLGPDLPVADWAATAERTHARAAVVGVLTAGDVRSAVDVAIGLREALPGLVIVFGGRAANRAGAAFETRSAARGGAPANPPPPILPEPLTEAVARLEDVLRRPA